MNKYISEFLSLKSSGDILKVCNPLGKKAEKEITESMSIIKYIRNISLKNPMKHTLYDMCAGNALTSIISVYLLPIKKAIAIDKRYRKRNWKLASRFEYHFKDIYKISPDFFEEDSIIIAVHCCKNLAERVIELYNNSNAKYLILMPCCIGQIKKSVPSVIRKKIGKYIIWCWQLTDRCNGTFKIDNNIISPKNVIITAKK